MQLSVNVAERQDALVSFFEDLCLAGSRVLMLDYDGTLAPFTPERNRAFPYPEVPGLISGIMQCRTRVVLISGRAAADVLRLCGIYPHPEIWGSHGAERIFPDGSYRLEQLASAQREALEIADRSLRLAGLASQIETKPTSLAIHWRGLSLADRAAIEGKVRAAYSDAVSRGELELFQFDGGLEIRSGSRNKGDAVRTVLHESGENAVAAYLGDDQTDEDAFSAIKEHGLAVLIRTERRPTAADVWLRPPSELIEFFEQWLVVCGETK